MPEGNSDNGKGGEIPPSQQYAHDVMVPVYNHLELTIPCLQALYAHTHYPFHLIITDYSTDLTPLYLTQFCKEHNNVTYIHSDVPCKSGNQFFNRALRECKTPFMTMAMNSIRVEPNWDIGPLQAMSDSKVGLVGIKCLLPNGTIESAWIVMQKYVPCDAGRGEPGHRHSLTQEVQAVQWAFAMGRVEALRGNLDEDVFHGHKGWDDIDNCFVLKSKGWKIMACGASAGYHQPRATRGDDSKDAQQKNRENGIRFMKRWGLYEAFVEEYGPDGNIHLMPKVDGKMPANPLPVAVATRAQ